LNKLFFFELTKNNIATIDTPKSEKNGPVIKRIGIKTIIQVGIVSK
tara:strand:+ start:31 stop:168 length:138 start_codon:yes stop_codon:yes gene_type:complete